jgi:hypothetical protein
MKIMIQNGPLANASASKTLRLWLIQHTRVNEKGAGEEGRFCAAPNADDVPLSFALKLKTSGHQYVCVCTVQSVMSSQIKVSSLQHSVYSNVKRLGANLLHIVWSTRDFCHFHFRSADLQLYESGWKCSVWCDASVEIQIITTQKILFQPLHM